MTVQEQEYALMLIEDYIAELDAPRMWLRAEVFDFRCFAEWGANELYDFVKQHEHLSPIEAVTLFAGIMDRYSSMKETGYRFSVAYDIAMDILDIFLTAF